MNPAVLRLLDANANRAREALRVLEDYARFVLDDRELSASLKTVRHGLAGALSQHLAEAILYRDTPGDVGAANKTQAELHREDLTEVVTAAGKRLGEALRALEEYCKTIAPADAARIEQLRYRFYEIEQRLARTLGKTALFSGVRLYVLITQSCCRGPWLEAAEEALAGGADCLQLREKTLDSAELLRRARQLVELCHRYERLCLINDRSDIAILSGADGVHVGQEDVPAIEVRKLVGPGKIIGVSTHNIAQAKRAWLDGADYIGVGPIFPSQTKPRDFVAGLEYARQAAAEIPIPVVAIAGITAGNVDEVLAAGIRAVAVTAAVVGCDDPRAAAMELKEKLMEEVGQTMLTPTPLESVREQRVGQTFLSASGRRPESGGADIPVCHSPSGRPLEITHRRLPHWQMQGSTYFVTFRVRDGELNAEERRIVLEHVKSGHGGYYALAAAVVMPDHVHVLMHPNGGFDLSRVCKGIKGVSARLVNQNRGTQGSLWQDECWDRIMRNQMEFDEKLQYMLENPVKRGLVSDPWEYDGWHYDPEWQTGMSAPPVVPKQG